MTDRRAPEPGPRARAGKEGAPPLPLVELRGEREAEVVAALCDAFHDYPVMRYVVGEAGRDYDRNLNELIGLFVGARVLRGDPIFAIEEGGRLAAVATTTPPGPHTPPSVLAERRDAVWRMLGGDAKARYEGLVSVWERVPFPEFHHHLNMLGVRRSHAGRGLGGRLLRAVHEMSGRDPRSAGVTLSTEDPKNVALYQHFGYEIVAYDRVSDDLETWSFLRRKSVDP